jgi:hypothetical protein
LDLQNGQDVLNAYYNGDAYIEKGFGFNVTLPIELYLNFGILSLPFMIIVGYIYGAAISKFHISVFQNGGDPGLFVLRLYAIWTITGSFAGFQWFILFYLSFFLFDKFISKSR